MFLLLSAIVRGDALSVAFHAPVPISAQVDEAPVAAAAVAPAGATQSVEEVELPKELTPQPISRTAGRTSTASNFSSTRGKARRDTGALSSNTLLETTSSPVATPGRAQEKTQEKAQRAKAIRKADHAAAKAQRAADRAAAKVQRATDKAAAKAQREAERAAAKAQRATDKAAAKAQREAERAAAKAQRATDKAAAKAQRDAEKAQRHAEKAASPAQGHPGQGAGKGAGHPHKH